MTDDVQCVLDLGTARPANRSVKPDSPSRRATIGTPFIVNEGKMKAIVFWGCLLSALFLTASPCHAAGGEMLAQSQHLQKAGKPKESEVFINFSMKEWQTYYDRKFRKDYPLLTKEQLRELGRYTYRQAEENGEGNHTYIFALLFLNWRAQLQGFSREFIEDATRFVLNETGTEFGIAWYEYQIKQLVASSMKP